MAKPNELEKRLQSLESHLQLENPVLLQAVQSFRKLDRAARRLGVLGPQESYATRLSWWPLISVLGTYSSGKSTFINHYLRHSLQATGNQAVDDRFTVICFSNEDGVRVLPGLALDADPRFPFYQMSRAIEEISVGEGSRIDAYLQLKTCPSQAVRGKILIDSPGFDADAQRTGTLRVTKHIIDLSDLVLVFFDARHPEPGTMHDTLEQLVERTIHRPDSSKFLYILNQIDHTAREDNPEDVIASWQRALAQKGLTAGRFYCIYSPEAAVPIEEPERRGRFESKRDIDLAEIHERMRQVEVNRAYRVVGLLEHTARDIEGRLVPRLLRMMAQWRKRVLWLDALAFGMVIALCVIGGVWSGVWLGAGDATSLWPQLTDRPVVGPALLVLALALAGYVHFVIRRTAARGVVARLRRELRDMQDMEFLDALITGFQKNTRFWRSVFAKRPAGWNQRNRRRIAEVLVEVNEYVQTLNDKFANPAGATGEKLLRDEESETRTRVSA